MVDGEIPTVSLNRVPPPLRVLSRWILSQPKPCGFRRPPSFPIEDSISLTQPAIPLGRAGCGLQDGTPPTKDIYPANRCLLQLLVHNYAPLPSTSIHRSLQHLGKRKFFLFAPYYWQNGHQGCILFVDKHHSGLEPATFSFLFYYSFFDIIFPPKALKERCGSIAQRGDSPNSPTTLQQELAKWASWPVLEVLQNLFYSQGSTDNCGVYE